MPLPTGQLRQHSHLYFGNLSPRLPNEPDQNYHGNDMYTGQFIKIIQSIGNLIDRTGLIIKQYHQCTVILKARC